jgi:predicted nucleic acid-binding protein
MTEPCVDTSVIIRLVSGDDPRKQTASAQLFEDIERGKLLVSTPDTVIADAVYVLSSPRTYRMGRPTVAAALTRLVRLPGFRVQNRRVVLRALDLFGTTAGLDFGDAMIVAVMEQKQKSTVYSYDADFDHFPWLTRREPCATR